MVDDADAYSALEADGDTIGLVTFSESSEAGWLIEQVEVCDAP